MEMRRMRRLIWVALTVALGWLGGSRAVAQSYSEWVDSAYACVQRDSLPQAVECLKAAIQKEPGNERNVLLFANIGSMQKQRGLLEEAVESYSLALNYKPSAMPILLARAATYMELGNESKAYVDYCNVLDQDIENREALTFRAYIAVHQRMYDVARADYNRLLTMDEKDPTARLGLALLNQKQGRRKEAVEQLAGLIADYPNDPTYYMARADVLADQELCELALLDMESAIKLRPDDPYAYVSRAEIYLQMKHRKKQARKDLDMAVSLGLPRGQLMNLYERCR